MTASSRPAAVHAGVVFFVGVVFYVGGAMVSGAVGHSAHVLGLLSSLPVTGVCAAAALFGSVPFAGLGVAANTLGIGALGYKTHLWCLGRQDG